MSGPFSQPAAGTPGGAAAGGMMQVLEGTAQEVFRVLLFLVFTVEVYIASLLPVIGEGQREVGWGGVECMGWSAWGGVTKLAGNPPACYVAESVCCHTGAVLCKTVSFSSGG